LGHGKKKRSINSCDFRLIVGAHHTFHNKRRKKNIATNYTISTGRLPISRAAAAIARQKRIAISMETTSPPHQVPTDLTSGLLCGDPRDGVLDGQFRRSQMYLITRVCAK
jgi:hypothetical protein